MTGLKPRVVLFCGGHDAMLAFYRDAIGLSTVSSEEGYSVLDANGLNVIVHSVPREVLATPAPGETPRRRWDVAIKPMFPVPSIAQVRARAEKLGGVIDPPDKEWAWDNFRSCTGQDPEGNVFEVIEPA